jgi:hypothetical protein
MTFYESTLGCLNRFLRFLGFLHIRGIGLDYTPRLMAREALAGCKAERGTTTYATPGGWW